MSDSEHHLLIISQVYVPDPASVGQHIADVAEEMAIRGWTVTVLTSNRGYDDPSVTFPATEWINGVNVRRLPFSSFGKKTIFHRLIGQLAFCLQAIFVGTFTRRLTSIFTTTSPPMGGIIGWAISLIRRKPLNFWVMDLNPDQAIAQGIVNKRSLLARIFNGINWLVLSRAQIVIALDRFMATKLEDKRALGEKLKIIPPWPMEGALKQIPKEDNPFIAEHKLKGKFVFMYSGNHSPVHPLDTFLKAAEILRDDPRIVFVFVGGGKAKAPIDAIAGIEESSNILSLPYQPLDRIKYSLSAADVHLVSMGVSMVGCVHPCKFYGAMSLSKPVLFLGPRESHIGDIMEKGGSSIGWQVDHGDIDTMVATIRSAVEMRVIDLEQLGNAGYRQIDRAFSKEILCKEFCDTIDT